MFAGHDTNGDKRVSRAEAEKSGPGALKTFDLLDTWRAGWIDLPTFLDLCLGVFRAADTDKDGAISIAERDAFRTQVKLERDKNAR